MATIQLGNTKIANSLISYCEKKAVERDGIDCDPNYAKNQFKATRELWGKDNGIQAHHVIQSFKPGEVTPEQANKIGKDLAEKIAKGHEVTVYTHADKKHIHNHIVINSVGHEDGKKYQLHGKKAIEKVRQISDDLCKEKALSIVKEPSAKQRYSRAEYGMAKRGEMSWKDDLRTVIDHAKTKTTNLKDFREHLKNEFNVDTRVGKYITYTHPEHEKVRGKILGLDYERGTIEHGFSRQIERGTECATTKSVRGINERDQRTQQNDEKLHKCSDGQRYSKESNVGSRANKDNKDKSRNSGKDDFNIEKARKYTDGLREQVSSSYGHWQERNEREQSKDFNQDDRDRGNIKDKHERNGKNNAKEFTRSRIKDIEFSR